MNKLCGKIYWNNAQEVLKTQEHESFTNGLLDLHVERMHNFYFDTKNFFYNERSHVLCAIIGYISNLEEIKLHYGISNTNDVEVVECLYSLKQLEYLMELDGVFSIFLFDERHQTSYIFQDEYGFNLPIYYSTIPNNGFIFSTSLKDILKDTRVTRELDLQAVHNFLYYKKIIPNKFTLIKNIHKLIPQTYLSIDGHTQSIEVVKISRKESYISREVAKNELISSIEKNINVLLNQLSTRHIALTLSSGFDSNLTLSLLRGLTDDVLKVITIGGMDKNEISQAQKIVSYYSDIKYISKNLQPDVIDYFPDIVWRTEGYVFDEGLFLQYALAQILHQENNTFIFLGECADQILDCYRNFILQKMLTHIKGYIKKGAVVGDLYYTLIKKRSPEASKTAALVYGFKNHSINIGYDIALDYVLKKNGILSNSFDIQGVYPFLNKKTKGMSKILGKLNAKKSFYKEQVKLRLGANISCHLKKLAGRTDIEYLLRSRQELIMKIFQSPCIKEILHTSQIHTIYKNPTYYPGLILQLLYLYLFNELFIKGKYRPEFDEKALNIPLYRFF